MPASSAAEGSKWKTTWLLGNKLRKPRYQPRSMTVEKVGDRGFVDADLEQRLDVCPVLGPIGQQHLGGHDFREAIPWIGQAGRPVNIGRPSAR